MIVMRISSAHVRNSMGWSVRCAIVLVSALASTLHAGDLAAPGPYAAGLRQVSVLRPNGTSFTAALHYPATSAGVDAPFAPAAGPCPCITFGHGYLQPVTQYASTLAHLATHGFIVIASQSEGGLLPNHGNLAKDMRACLDWLETQHASTSSDFAGAIDLGAFGASGHSMGGGASILATKDDPRIKALAPTAPADTSPSSIAAMSAVPVPTRLIVGSQDSIVPPATSAMPMYANAAGPKQLLSIQGGFHCGFTDAGFAFCDSGSITRPQQLSITRRLLTEFFQLHLRRDQSIWPRVWGTESPSANEATMLRDARLTIAIKPTNASVPPGAAEPISVDIVNDGPGPTEVRVAIEPANGWIGTPPEAIVGPIAPGASATVTLNAAPVLGASGATLLVTGRRESDGATRAFTSLAVTIEVATADLDGNGIVNGADLAILLGAWGPCPGVPCAADLTGDGAIDGGDLAVLLGQWS